MRKLDLSKIGRQTYIVGDEIENHCHVATWEWAWNDTGEMVNGKSVS